MLLLVGKNYAQQMQQQRQQQTQVPQNQQSSPASSHDFLATPEYAALLQQEFKTRTQNQKDTDTQTKAETKKTVHERICPTCGSLSTTCSTDQERLSRGIVLTCGCSTCGGNGYA